jgi:hypothetical protein
VGQNGSVAKFKSVAITLYISIASIKWSWLLVKIFKTAVKFHPTLSSASAFPTSIPNLVLPFHYPRLNIHPSRTPLRLISLLLMNSVPGGMILSDNISESAIRLATEAIVVGILGRIRRVPSALTRRSV